MKCPCCGNFAFTPGRQPICPKCKIKMINTDKLPYKPTKPWSKYWIKKAKAERDRS